MILCGHGLQTSEGTLPFQVYFVRERWQPTVTGIDYRGAAEAVPSPPVARALHQATAIIFGPSNPFLSIDPISGGAGHHVTNYKRRCACSGGQPHRRRTGQSKGQPQN